MARRRYLRHAPSSSSRPAWRRGFAVGRGVARRRRAKGGGSWHQRSSRTCAINWHGAGSFIAHYKWIVARPRGVHPVRAACLCSAACRMRKPPIRNGGVQEGAFSISAGEVWRARMEITSAASRCEPPRATPHHCLAAVNESAKKASGAVNKVSAVKKMNRRRLSSVEGIVSNRRLIAYLRRAIRRSNA